MDRRALARKSLERRLSPLRTMELAVPSRGWLRPVREALGMTSVQLAKRLGVVPSRITALEKDEARGAVTLKTLREAAAAMDCMLVYAIVPKQPLDDIVRERAQRRAAAEIARVSHTMALEDQAPLSADIAAQIDRKVEDLLGGPLRRLWEDS